MMKTVLPVLLVASLASAAVTTSKATVHGGSSAGNLEYFAPATFSSASADVPPPEESHQKAMQQQQQPHLYGVDVSFPIHHANVSSNFIDLPHNVLPELYPVPDHMKDQARQPLGRDRQKVYNDYVNGCRKHYEEEGWRCWLSERDRIAMNLRQPQSMVNYTKNGFAKVSAPADLWDAVHNFWKKNLHQEWQPEVWPKGNTYVNHWSSSTFIVDVDHTQLRGLHSKLWTTSQTVLEDWTGQELTRLNMYGVRIYTDGAMLAPHVDRLPQVTSAIINVAQDVDEDWPMELIGHDGVAYNVTLEPGEMLLYESHSVLHGRPFALKGRYVANLYVHFEPNGHSLRHHNHEYTGNYGSHRNSKPRTGPQPASGMEAADHGTDFIPPYLIPDSPEAVYEKERDEQARKNDGEDRQPLVMDDQQKNTKGLTSAHHFAAVGKVQMLKPLLDTDESLVHAKDANGWTPLHEGARGGHVEVVQLLLDRGADVNQRSHEGTGGTALWFAETHHGRDSAVYQLIQAVGGVRVGPDL